MTSTFLGELAEETLRVLREQGEGGKPLTLQQASNRSGVSASMIQAMTKGRTVGCEGIIRFAKSFGEDIPRWLDLAGYQDIADYWRYGASDQKRPLPVADELERMISGLPDARQPMAREAVRRTVKSVIMPLLEAA